ncbi:MAG: hypothetical protein KDA60_04420 [Planctomycetales bacterium]|nr:hypothetical protein [Planctomycetales bacterium]
MNLIRSLISILLVAVIAVSIAGWFWAGTSSVAHPVGARVALTLCGLASLAAMRALWIEVPLEELETDEHSTPVQLPHA